MHGPIRLPSSQTVKRLGLLPAGRRRSLSPPDLARLSLVDSSEYSIKSSDAAEAGAKCDFRQRQVRLVNERLARCTRTVLATSIGRAPTCFSNSRLRWRAPTPGRV